MRVLGAVLTVAATLAGCDAGPDDVVDDAILIRHDMQPDPMLDTGPRDEGQDIPEVGADGPPDAEPDMPVDAEPDMPHAPDTGPPEPCAAPDAVLSAELDLVDRAWRVELLERATEARLAPVCGDEMPETTGGRELKVRVLPDVDGQYLVGAAGRFSASYRTSPCTADQPPLIDGCEQADSPERANRSARIAARAGEAFDLVFDAAPGERAGPVLVVVYPPVPEGGSCAPIDDDDRPSCAPEHGCIEDVCRYVGPPRANAVRAWSDGQSLRLEADFSGIDLFDALWVRTGDSAFVQASVTAAIAPAGGLIQGFIEDPILATSERIEVEMLDGASRKGRGRAQVAPLVPLDADAACDEDGMRDACSPGDACVGGRCQETQLGAWRTDDGLNLDVVMHGAPAGPRLNAVVRARDAAPETRWSPLPEQPAEIGRRWTDLGVQAPAAGFLLRIQPSGRPPGLPVVIEPDAQPVQDEGEICDLDGIASRCAGALACLPAGVDGRCVAIDPPVIDELGAWAGVDALGIKASFRDPQNDAERMRFTVFDDEAEVRFITDEPLWIPDAGQGFFVLSLDAAWGPEVNDVLQLELIDATGMVSDPVRARLLPPPPVELGVACDPRRAWAICEDDDAICAALDPDADPRCALFERTCPEDWRPFPLVAPTRHDDNSAGGPNRTAGLCGGGATPEAIYEVQARRDARWRISTLPPRALIYARTHCRFAVEDESELACDDGGIEFDVDAGETYYIFVDGPGDGGRFALLIDEFVRDGPLPIEPVD